MNYRNQASQQVLPEELRAKNAEIEKLAYTIKFAKLPEGKRPELMNRLTEIILSSKGLTSFIDLDQGTASHTLAEYRGYEKYSGLVYANVIKDVFNFYGMKDSKTGKIIPYMKLFNNLLKMREHSITKEKCEEKDYDNAKTREALMRSLVKAKVKNSSDRVPNLNNEEKMVKYLENNGCSQEIIDQARRILANSYVSSDALPSKDDPESTIWQSDAVAIDDYEASEAAVRAIEDCLQVALANTTSPTLREYILYYVNLKLFSYVPSFGKTCHASLFQYYDPELLSFATKLNTDDEAIVLSKYLNIAEESARKNVKKAKKALERAA